MAAVSLLCCRPILLSYFGNDSSSKRKPVQSCSVPAREFFGKRLHCSSVPKLGVDHLRHSFIKAQAMELTKEAYSFREQELSLHDFRYIDTGVDRKPGLWPPNDKVDNPSLHNPLLRQERMGCGWLGAIFEWEGVLIEDYPGLEKQAWLTLSEEEGKSPPPAFILRRIEGMKNEQAISEVLFWSRDPSQLRRMASRKEEIYQALQGGVYQFRSGSQEFVNILMHYKIPMALVSTRPRKFLENAIGNIEI